MLSRRTFTLASLACTAGCGGDDALRRRFGLSAARSNLEDSAKREGSLRIDAATGLVGIEDLLASFKALYPGIDIKVRRVSSHQQYVNFLREIAAGVPTSDLLISPAMDLQFKLVNDGHALTYKSPEKPHLPDWAVWNDQAYAVTTDPLVFVYNKALMPPEDVPQSHYQLTDLLRRKKDRYRGMIATYDPERSGTGYLYYTQDLQLSRDTLDLVQAMGRTQPKFYITGAVARDKVAVGEHLLAYNMVNSYMMLNPTLRPDLAIVFPSDYTLVVSRIAFIPQAAAHPAAGKLFLDFLLSEAGQILMTRQQMQPVRNGVILAGSAPPTEVTRRINFGPSLLANIDNVRRRQVLHEWRRAFES